MRASAYAVRMSNIVLSLLVPLFAELWVQRAEFTAKYGASSTYPDFVDALITNVNNGSGVNLSSRRSELIGECNIYAGDTKVQRSHVLRKLIDLTEFARAEYNRAFITSPEYQQRFSAIVTRNDSVCAPQ